MKKRHRFFAFILCIIVLIVCAKPLYTISMKALYPLRYEEYILEYTKEYNLDKFLVMALIKAESNYIYDAHSGVATGLMQITDETANWIAEKMSIEFSKDDIKNPVTNINMGCYYLRYLLDYYEEDETLALCAYNAGMGNVNKWLSDKSCSKDGKVLNEIPFEETRKYIEKIEKYKEIYTFLYNKED